MYCKYCGKHVDGQINICEDCYKKLNEPIQSAYSERCYKAVNNPAPIKPAQANPSGGSKMTGFGKALASVIIGEPAIALSLFYMLFSGVLTVMLMNAEAGAAAFFTFISLFFAIPAAALTALTLIFGIKSIKTYVKEVRQNRVKPLVTLILGIAGTVCGAISAFIFVLSFEFLFMI